MGPINNPTATAAAKRQQQRRGTSEVLDTVQAPRVIAVLSQKLARMEAFAKRVTDARTQSSSRKHAVPSKGQKEAAAARRSAKRPA